MTNFDDLDFYPGEEQYAVPHRCRILEWGIAQPKAGEQGVQVILKMHCVQYWDSETKTWNALEAPMDKYKLSGEWTLIKKDGTVNPSGLDQLQRANIGLDAGMIAYMANNAPPETLVVVETELDEYNGKKRVRPTWLNSAEHIPGTGGARPMATKEQMLAMNEQQSSKLRALAKPVPPGK